MISVLLGLTSMLMTADTELGPGEHVRRLEVGGQVRNYLLYLPNDYQAKREIPVVLCFHGAGMRARTMVRFCGLNEKANQAGFAVAYPNGGGLLLFPTFNSGGINGPFEEQHADDTGFAAAVLDDLESTIRVDSQRVYATGFSNGAMMCYRLAAEMSSRIAAIAAVGGTLGIDNPRPTRDVPVLHFHGTEDRIVPYHGPGNSAPSFLTFKSVDDTVDAWKRLIGAAAVPIIERLPDIAAEGTTVSRLTYRPPAKDRENAEFVLVVVEGGGHTWPGRDPNARELLGKSTHDITANDLIWNFFQKHPLPTADPFDDSRPQTDDIGPTR